MDAEVFLFQDDMHGFFESYAVVVGQVFGEKAGKRAVAHHDLHVCQQRVSSGDLVPEGDGGSRIRDVGRHDPAGQHVTQRVNQHQTLASLDQLAGIETNRGPGGRGRVFHALRVDNNAGGLSFFGVFSRQATFRQAFSSSRGCLQLGPTFKHE